MSYPLQRPVKEVTVKRYLRNTDREENLQFLSRNPVKEKENYVGSCA
jgi:hypothetical protein